MWWILAVVSSIGFYAFYRSVATNRAQQVMPACGVAIGVLGAILFGASHEFSVAQVLPMYTSALTAAVMAGIGHREVLRKMWRVSAEKGNGGVGWPSKLLALQVWSSIVIIGGLGVWFAASVS